MSSVFTSAKLQRYLPQTTIKILNPNCQPLHTKQFSSLILHSQLKQTNKSLNSATFRFSKEKNNFSLFIYPSNNFIISRNYYRGYNPVHHDEDEPNQGVYQRFPSRVIPHPVAKILSKVVVLISLLIINCNWIPLAGLKLTLFNAAFATGFGYLTSLPFWIVGIVIAGIVLISYLPEEANYAAYDISFDQNVLTALNNDKRAINEFGTPIVRPPWSASKNTQHVVSKRIIPWSTPESEFNEDKRTTKEVTELTITKQFEILGAVKKGQVVVTATTLYDKNKDGRHYWNIDQIFWYPDVKAANPIVRKKYRSDVKPVVNENIHDE